MLRNWNVKAKIGAIGILGMTVFFSGILISRVLMAQELSPELSGNEVAYRFNKDTGQPEKVAENLSISDAGVDFIKRERIVDSSPPQAYVEYVIDSGSNCDLKLNGVELAVLRTEFADAYGWGRYAGEFLGPNCPGSSTATSTPENLFFPVIDDGGCRGYLTAEINPSGFVKELNYDRICPGGNLN